MIAWYWLLIPAAVALGLCLLLGYLWGRRNAPIDHRLALKDSQIKSLTEQHKAEQKAKQLAIETAKALAEEQRLILTWYNETKASIREEARDDFEKLSTDSDALDARLNRLLGTDSSRDDDTPTIPG